MNRESLAIQNLVPVFQLQLLGLLSSAGFRVPQPTCHSRTFHSSLFLCACPSEQAVGERERTASEGGVCRQMDSSHMAQLQSLALLVFRMRGKGRPTPPPLSPQSHEGTLDTLPDPPNNPMW